MTRIMVSGRMRLSDSISEGNFFVSVKRFDQKHIEGVLNKIQTRIENDSGQSSIGVFVVSSIVKLDE